MFLNWNCHRHPGHSVHSLAIPTVRARFGPPVMIRLAIFMSGHRSGSKHFAELSSLAVAPPPCLDTAPPTSQRKSQAVKAGW